MDKEEHKKSWIQSMKEFLALGREMSASSIEEHNEEIEDAYEAGKSQTETYNDIVWGKDEGKKK